MAGIKTPSSLHLFHTWNPKHPRIKIVVSIWWFQIFTWKIDVSPCPSIKKSGCLGFQGLPHSAFWTQTFIVDMATLRSPGLTVKLLVGYIRQIPRSTQRSCLGIRQSPKMCQVDKGFIKSNTWCSWWRFCSREMKNNMRIRCLFISMYVFLQVHVYICILC